QIIPSDEGEPKDLWNIRFNSSGPSQPARFPDIRFMHVSGDFELFAFGLHRQSGPAGQIAHLMDLTGQLWRFPGDDNPEHFSPYEVLGFAEGGKSVIARSGKTLFTLSVSAIQTAENKAGFAGPKR